MKKFVEKDVAENPLYHDTWKLLKKYRDVVWSLEISVQHVRAKFEIEYGISIEEFLDSVYLAGADLNGSNIEHHAKCIERSHKMLKLLDSAVELLRTRHKNGEAYYWLLYYRSCAAYRSHFGTGKALSPIHRILATVLQLVTAFCNPVRHRDAGIRMYRSGVG